MTIQTHKNNKEFHDNPPEFKAADRKRYFYIDTHFKQVVTSQVRGNDNKVFIVVAYGYFKATGQFYDTAEQDDLDYVANRMGANVKLDWKNYNDATQQRHRILIRDALGYRPFSQRSIAPLLTILKGHARSQKNPERCFESVCEWLFANKIETPNYDTIQDTIHSLFSNHLNDQLSIVRNNLSVQDRALLDSLFEKSNLAGDPMKTHRLTLLKKFNQSIKTNQIRENIEAFDLLKPLYDVVAPVVSKLDFSQQGLKRFSRAVNKGQVFQIKRLQDDDRYLHLTIFIAQQFNLLVDILVETFLAAVKHAINKAEKLAKDEYYKQRKEQAGHTRNLVTVTINLVEIIEQIKVTLNNPLLTDKEKVAASIKLLSPKKDNVGDVDEHIKNVNDDLEKLSGQALLMKYLEEGARSLQLKCSDILCRFDIDQESLDLHLLKAINRYQEKSGKVDGSFPIGFMEASERRYVDDVGGFNKQLYRVMLYRGTAQAIKSGIINISNSSRFRQLDQYLISKEFYQKNRSRLLKLADMEDFSDVNDVLHRLELELDAQFKETNDHIMQNINEFVEPNLMGGYKLVSYRNTLQEAIFEANFYVQLFPENEFISIAEAVNTVNSAIGFLDEFEHNQLSHLKQRPENRNFIAGIIALGEHLSINKLSKLTKQIERSTLETVTKSFFTLENLQRANTAIVRFVNQLPLSNLFIGDFGMQTSSDGQKWSVANESLNSNRSFKYGGGDPVLASYTMTDARGMFPNSMVISGAEREAHYMIDLVLKNEAVKSEMHSTDSHGYTEAVFGLTDLLKISFAPRIKQPGKRHLHSFRTPLYYKNRGYPIFPQVKVDSKLIIEYWEEILRVAVSIKLGEVTASQIFKRMNSYSAKHNPLYNAIKAYGGISKTLFLLRYADDIDMRHAIQKQLNKGESANRLDKALAIGRQEYTQVLKEDQEIAETCKRLLKNVVVCWNMMYLSNKIASAGSAGERSALIKKIKSSSMIAWEHFIFHGEFDFSDPKLKDSQDLDFRKMMDPDLIKE